MSAPRTIVSGGTGYVGRFIVEELLSAGHEVTVLGRRRPARDYFSTPVGFLPLSLEPEQASPSTFEGADFFVHAAFDHIPGKYRGGEGDDPQAFRRRNLDGSIALFEGARSAGISRLVFLSSRAVYGPRPPGTLLAEEHEPCPDTLYGQVKLEAERALASLGGPFHGVSLRVTGVYGPAGKGQRHKWADLFEDYLAGKVIEPRVATEVHGQDVGQAVRVVLEAPEAPSPLLNVSDLLLDRQDLLAIVKDKKGCRHPLPPRADGRAVNAMRTNRLRSLGWRPGGEALLTETVIRLLEQS